MGFFEQLEREWAVLTQAPLTFVVMMAAAVAAAYALARLHYGREIAALNAIIRQKDTEIGDWKRKTDGATPDEVKARLEALEKQVGAMGPRRLKSGQTQVLHKALGGLAPQTITITRDGAAGDAYAYISDIARVFEELGWQVSLPVAFGVGVPPRTGVGFRVANPSALSAVESSIARAFEAAGIAFDVQQGGSELEVLVSVPFG